ncbi:MAG: hypothetical protein JWP38_3107 [Herbaspirillum sp.]|nr:hypothetical protein [Herbaspirillum sp.]
MSLKRLFRLISIALMSLFLLLTAGLLATQWDVYRRGVESVQIVRHLHLALRVMELMSAEREPTNAVLGAESAEMPEARAKLAQARLKSDISIKQLQQALGDERHDGYRAIAANITMLSEELHRARKSVDELADHPLPERRSEDIAAAANRMIALIQRPVVATADLANIAGLDEPGLRDGIASARLAASMREYAGQIGSQFTAAIAKRLPLRSDEVIEISKLSGRAEQMRFILNLQLRSYKTNRQLEAALNKVDTVYFGEGLPLLNRLLQIGLKSGDYGVTTSALAAQYVPKMQSIVELRDLILEDCLDSAEARTRRALQTLLAAIALAAVALAVFYLLLRTIRKRLVTPMLESTRLFVALANGELETPIPPRHGDDEISNLFRAMEVFTASCIARISLEQEREALITQLKATSDTDFLTGLMNRRAFFTQGEPLFGIAQRYQNELSLVLMDIDHFKQVNDQHGHQTGDLVLQQIATLCRKMHRKIDVVVRYGGEEFLMLLPHTDMKQATLIAEKLRLAICSHTIQLTSGASLRVSASFGVTSYDQDISLDALILRADQALYYAKNHGRNQVQNTDAIAIAQILQES